MAKIKFGALMVDARGKLGGHVFSKNRSGSYLRTKVTPVNGQTTYQTAVRAAFGAISAQWSGLTQAARDAWNGAVEDWQRTDIFGDIKNPSGKALYQRLNNQLQAAGLAAVGLPPAKLGMPDAVITEAAIDLTADTVEFTDRTIAAGTQVVVFATAPLSQGTKFVKNRLRQIGAYPADTMAAGDVYDDYVAKFGAPLAGQNIFFGVKYVLATGQASPMQTLKAVIVP